VRKGKRRVQEFNGHQSTEKRKKLLLGLGRGVLLHDSVTNDQKMI
jgi:hypothetical protein